MIITVVDDTHFVSGFELKYVRVESDHSAGGAFDAQRFVVGERGGGEEWAEFGPCFKSGYGADLTLYHVDGSVAARFAGANYARGAA